MNKLLFNTSKRLAIGGLFTILKKSAAPNKSSIGPRGTIIMKNERISIILLFATLFSGVLISSASSANPNMTCEEIEPDFYRCVALNMCSDEVRWSAPDDILVYPSGGLGSTMALIRDRDINGCIVAVADSGFATARYSTCSNSGTYSGGNCGTPPTPTPTPTITPTPPPPRVSCEEIRPDFYRCVTHGMGSGAVHWTAPDDILVYPDGGVGSTMALIQDRDINGCIVAVASGANGTARYSTCRSGFDDWSR